MKRAAVETFDPRPAADPAEARIAVTLPCYNEAATIARVIEDFRAALDINPGQPQVLNYLGYSMVEHEVNLDEALNMIERAVA